MMDVFKKLLGQSNEAEVKRLQKIANQVLEKEAEYKALSDAQLQAKTPELKQRLKNGETLDDILPDAFAACREAADRTVGMRPYPVQVIGGVCLHQGRIAEMKTGEGKTLVATLPAYLNALTGEGVHIVTVNDYLAKRDSEWMGKIYKFMGLSVGLIVHDLDNAQRRQAYACDITYGTNNEMGFDYLRDNMVIHERDMVQRGHVYAIVDEVDSILIDEARTPLIISGQGDKSTDLYEKADRFVSRLKNEEDYTVAEKEKAVSLTEQGIAKAQKAFDVENIADLDNSELYHHILAALKAHAIMKRDVDYVVQNGEVVIVDEFTGRLMVGRRYSDGLHQAIEAKEHVKVERESKTLATITFQNYFRMYKKISGMTGTAKTEEEEFQGIYNLDVVQIPTNKPMIRKDMNDMVYKTKRGKFNAVVEEIVERHATGQPILVGTVNVETSEMLSHLIKLRGVPHEVLNAKNHQKEAEIVAQAGHVGAVTIATNMAGRGTDILLGGNPDFLARRAMRQESYPDEIIEAATGHNENVEQSILDARKRYRELLDGFKRETDAEHERVMGLGGLHIIGTERHESRRIDNQLRGRAGRQGDPGSTQFFISLEDDVMRLFGSERIAPMIEKLGMTEDQPLEAGMLTKQIESAQKRIEGRNFSIRKSVLQYDDIMNKQRELIYGQRRDILLGHDVRQNIIDMVHKLIESTAERNFTGEGSFDWAVDEARDYLERLCLKPGTFEKYAGAIKAMDEPAELTSLLCQDAEAFYAEREAMLTELGIDMREFERVVLLSAIDRHWMDHIDAMDDLRDGIGLRAYGQRDPVQEYRMESYDMFNDMVHFIREETVRRLYQSRIERLPERRRAVNLDDTRAALQGEQNTNGQAKKGGAPTNKSIPGAPGRNQPCPCGSGKKYKHCCGAGK
ncbi:MAG: preprotein translocase subunit SecA [Clostridiales bacterium]|nr:preprotein translocase subunit SecA [Clostridiales bacterium]MDO4351105.1 preprotein translocase subunit SecA [Eubacteriales bacterium]